MFGRRNIFDLIALPAGLLAFGLLAWWAIYAGPDRADKIEAALKAEIAAALQAPEFEWVSLDVDGRTVRIAGTAPSSDVRDMARAHIRRVSGGAGIVWGRIARVTDRTEVLPPLEAYELRAFRTDDHIQLEGSFPGPHGRDRVLAFLARQGVAAERVSDLTGFRDGVPDGDWFGTVELGLGQLLRLQEGEMNLVGKRLLLSGAVSTDAVRASVLNRLTRPPSGYSVDADFSGAVIWSASLANNRLVLNGSVPDAPERTQLAELADRFFDGDIVNNQRIRQMSDRAWMTGVRTALPGFLAFLDGEMTYRGNELLISGRATRTVIDHLREDVVRVGSLVSFRFEVTPALKPLAAFANRKQGVDPGADICQAGLVEAVSGDPISFVGRGSTLSRETGLALDGVETVLMTCPDQILEISAFTHVDDRYVSGKELTEGRQRAVSDYFIARGVPLNQIELTDVITGMSAPDLETGGRNTSQIRMRLKE